MSAHLAIAPHAELFEEGDGTAHHLRVVEPGTLIVRGPSYSLSPLIRGPLGNISPTGEYDGHPWSYRAQFGLVLLIDTSGAHSFEAFIKPMRKPGTCCPQTELSPFERVQPEEPMR